MGIGCSFLCVSFWVGLYSYAFDLVHANFSFGLSLSLPNTLLSL